MSKPIIMGVGILAFISGGILLLTQGGTTLEEQGTTLGSQRQVKDFTFVDYDGNTVALADFSGKPLVINSWASWCPFCVKELPDFTLLQKKFPEMVVIAVDRRESLNTAKSYTDDIGITDDLVFLLDNSDSFYRSIGGFTMPETIFVDAEGNIRHHKRGPMNVAEISQRAQQLFNL